MSPMHFITLFPDMMEVESRGASSSSEGGSQTLGRGTRVQIPPVYVCVLPLEDRRGGQNNQTQVVVFKALIFGMRQTLKIVNI